MFSAKRNREKAMQGLVAPQVRAVTMDRAVLDDVAARYGVPVSPTARAVRVEQGGSAQRYGVNAAGHQVWVQAVLVVDNEVPDDVVPVGFFEARSRAMAAGRRNAEKALAVRGRVAALHAEGLTDVQIADALGLHAGTIGRHRQHLNLVAHCAGSAVVDASRGVAAMLAQVRDMVSLGHSRADVMAALNVSSGAMRRLIKGQQIVWPTGRKAGAVNMGKGIGAATVLARQAVLALHEQGLTVSQIAMARGVRVGGIYVIMAKMGIKPNRGDCGGVSA